LNKNKINEIKNNQVRGRSTFVFFLSIVSLFFPEGMEIPNVKSILSIACSTEEKPETYDTTRNIKKQTTRGIIMIIIGIIMKIMKSC
jgi:hypothetical protein